MDKLFKKPRQMLIDYFPRLQIVNYLNYALRFGSLITLSANFHNVYPPVKFVFTVKHALIVFYY